LVGRKLLIRNDNIDTTATFIYINNYMEYMKRKNGSQILRCLYKCGKYKLLKYKKYKKYIYLSQFIYAD
jgi:hypothetical protein